MKIKRFNNINENYDQDKVKFIDAESSTIVEYGAVEIKVNDKPIIVNIQATLGDFFVYLNDRGNLSNNDEGFLEEIEILKNVGVEFHPGTGQIKSEDFIDHIQNFYQNKTLGS